MKIDNHIHAASAMTQNEMLQFIRTKFIEEAGTKVMDDKDGGEPHTLQECLEACGIKDPATLTTDKLEMGASAKMFHRFDAFNDAYNPFGKTDLRTVFMKTSNKIEGRYFAELLRDKVFTRVASAHSTTQAMEPRLSIYGLSGMREWQDLARFFVNHRVLSPTGNIRWMIQVPRLCNIFMGGAYKNFGQLMQNIFDPMIAATLEPEKYPELHVLLCNIGAIDSVDDESVYDPAIMDPFVSPFEYTKKENPPYSYWAFFMAENLKQGALFGEIRDAHVYTLSHTHTHTHTCTYVHLQTHTHTNTNTQTHTQTHTYKHTHAKQ